MIHIPTVPMGTILPAFNKLLFVFMSWAVLMILLNAWPFPASAQESAPNKAELHSISAPAMTLREVIEMVLATNPELLGQRFALRAIEGLRHQESLRPPIQLGAEVENLFGTGQLNAFDDVEATLRLGTVLELGGKRNLRVARVDRQRDLLEIELDAQRLDILSDVARRFIELMAAQENWVMATEQRKRAERTAEWVGRRQSIGAGSPLENGTAQVSVSLARLAESEARSAAQRTWAILASTWGGAAEGTGKAEGNLFDLPPLNPFSRMADAVDESPTLLKFASERRLAEARLRLTRSQRTPDVTVSAGVRRLQRTKDQAFILSATIPLGTGGRNAGAEQEAAAHMEQVNYSESAARASLLATLFALHQQAEQARLSLRTLTQDALPVAEDTLARMESGFMDGRFTYLELSAAQEQLRQIDVQRIEAASTYHDSILEIERLIGDSPNAGEFVTPNE